MKKLIIGANHIINYYWYNNSSKRKIDYYR